MKAIDEHGVLSLDYKDTKSEFKGFLWQIITVNGAV